MWPMSGDIWPLPIDPLFDTCGVPVAVHSGGVSEAAHRLVDFGCTNVSVYKEGLEGWKRAGNEVVRPEQEPAA